MKYLIMGSGRMAIGVVHDLLSQQNTEEIVITDNNSKALEKLSEHFEDERIKTYKVDSDDQNKVLTLMKDADGVLSAVPYDYNLNLTRWAIETGCHFVDLGGNYRVVESQFVLDLKAKRAGVGIVPDCGLAPGMTSVVAAHAIGRLDMVDTLEIRAGGLPVEPQTPLKYMMIFSAHGLTNEYLERSVILEDGNIKTVPSMTDIETLEFPQPFGKLEAFYTSGGTSTLPKTYEGEIRKLNFKSIRYPGHCELFKSMIDLGFAEEDTLEIQDRSNTRRDIFERLLEETLTYEGEDVVLLRVTAKGVKNGKEKILIYQAIEYGDMENNLTAMMRTTAFPAALTLEMLTDGRIKDRGVLYQELAIPPDIYLQELERRNIHFEISS